MINLTPNPNTLEYNTLADLQKAIKFADPERKFKVGKVIHVNNKMQKGYSYKLTEPIGKNFDPSFTPSYSPKEMLEMGVFEGKYCNDCILEYPKEWFETAIRNRKLSPEHADKMKNYYRVKSRQPLSTWRAKNWIYGNDPRGWFEWYMRYYLGRRDPSVDRIQIKRWKHNVAHLGALRKQCGEDFIKDHTCGLVRKQLLLNWSFPMK